MGDYIIILQYVTISCQPCMLKIRKIIQIMAWPNEYIVISCFEISYKQYVISDFIVYVTDSNVFEIRPVVV